MCNFDKIKVGDQEVDRRHYVTPLVTVMLDIDFRLAGIERDDGRLVPTKCLAIGSSTAAKYISALFHNFNFRITFAKINLQKT